MVTFFKGPLLSGGIVTFGGPLLLEFYGTFLSSHNFCPIVKWPQYLVTGWVLYGGSTVLQAAYLSLMIPSILRAI